MGSSTPRRTGKSIKVPSLSVEGSEGRGPVEWDPPRGKTDGIPVKTPAVKNEARMSSTFGTNKRWRLRLRRVERLRTEVNRWFYQRPSVPFRFQLHLFVHCKILDLGQSVSSTTKDDATADSREFDQWYQKE